MNRSLPSERDVWGDAAVHVSALAYGAMCVAIAFGEDGDYSEPGSGGAQTGDGHSSKAGVKALGYQKRNA